MHRPIALIVLVAALLAAAVTGLASTPAPPVFGPGAVIAMHKKLFAAIDKGDVQGALEFLQPDMNVGEKYRERPCTLYLVGPDGSPQTAVGTHPSRKLFNRWIQESVAGGWTTKIVEARDDCFSGELSYAVLEFERTQRTKKGGTTTRRFRSTSLVTYDEGWKLTHWHVSPADAAE